jgi:small subunit ribosomal protein S2
MNNMPGVMFLVDTRREHIAVKEARKLGVPTIALIDTDSDPDLIDLPIPGNDDAMRAIEIILHEVADSIIEGKQVRPELKGEEPQGGPRRRSTRSQFRAEDGTRTEGAPASPDVINIDLPTTGGPVEDVPSAQAVGEPVAAG